MNFHLMELNRGLCPFEFIESKLMSVVERYYNACKLKSSSFSVNKCNIESPLVSLVLRSKPLSLSIHSKFMF